MRCSARFNFFLFSIATLIFAARTLLAQPGLAY